MLPYGTVRVIVRVEGNRQVPLDATAVHAVAQQLDELLSQLDPKSASALEQTVQSVLVTVKDRIPTEPAKDAKGFPIGYFDTVIGCLEGQPFDYPTDPPPDTVLPW